MGPRDAVTRIHAAPRYVLHIMYMSMCAHKHIIHTYITVRGCVIYTCLYFAYIISDTSASSPRISTLGRAWRERGEVGAGGGHRGGPGHYIADKSMM